MSTTTITAPTLAAESTTSPTCESCSHPVATHDLIAVRYCRATAASALIRACICKSGPN
jgi:hypothetical protein